MPTGCIQSSSSQPMSVSGSPTVVISQSKTALTSPPMNAKLPGLASPCTRVILGHGWGLLSRSASQPFQGGQRIALDPMHLGGPMVEFAVQVVAAVIERAQPALSEVDRVDGRELFGHAFTHARHRRRPHRRGPPSHRRHRRRVPSRRTAVRARRRCPRATAPPEPHRGVLQRAQDVELAREVVGLQQRRRFGTQPQHHILAFPGRRAASRRSTPSSRRNARTSPGRAPRPGHRRRRAVECAATRSTLDDVSVQRHWRAPVAHSTRSSCPA